MEWFWDAYIADPAQRLEITASPNQATIEQLTACHHTVARRGGRRAAATRARRRPAKLRRAGVPVTTVRYNGTCHDFMLLNALSQTKATRAAVAQATTFLRDAFGSDCGPRDRAQRAHR